MAETAYWRCPSCSETTKVNLDIRVPRRGAIEYSNVFCKKCGFGSGLLKATLKKNAEGKNWCSCIPLTGIAAQIPLGKGPGGIGWMDANGRGPYSREDFRERFCVDPEINWYYRQPGQKPNGWSPDWCDNPMVESDVIPKPAVQDDRSKEVEATLRDLKKKLNDGELTLDQWRKKVKEVLANY